MRRLLRPAALGAVSLLLAGVLTLVAAVTLGGSRSDAQPGGRSLGRTSVSSTALLSSGGGDSIAVLQSRLRSLPRDPRGWAALALAYVEQARVTADPAYYPRAERAVARGAALTPNDGLVLTARGALAAARHEFTGALSAADRAIDVDPYGAAAWAVRSDALTELGRYDAALSAARRADDLDPGPGTFARLSYQAELRGRLGESARLMRLARDASTADAAAYAFTSFHLGELARLRGRLDLAAARFADALEAQPGYAPALAGQARIAAASGHPARAERLYREVVSRLPLPEYLQELADLYVSQGRDSDAGEQVAVAAASARLAAAAGVRTDLETAVLEADHGDADSALTAARAEWRARRTVHTADAMAWALHAVGRDAAAIAYARQATALGTPDARFWFHRGAIEAALELAGPAREHLRTALRLDAGVAPLREQQARELLRGLR